MCKGSTMKELLKKLWKDDRGTETVEWAIVIGIIAVGAIVMAINIGAHVQNSFANLNSAAAGMP